MTVTHSCDRHAFHASIAQGCISAMKPRSSKKLHVLTVHVLETRQRGSAVAEMSTQSGEGSCKIGRGNLTVPFTHQKRDLMQTPIHTP